MPKYKFDEAPLSHVVRKVKTSRRHKAKRAAAKVKKAASPSTMRKKVVPASLHRPICEVVMKSLGVAVSDNAHLWTRMTEAWEEPGDSPPPSFLVRESMNKILQRGVWMGTSLKRPKLGPSIALPRCARLRDTASPLRVLSISWCKLPRKK